MELETVEVIETPEVEVDVDQPETSKMEKKTSVIKTPKKAPCKLPLARVKGIMKMDPDCQLISQDAVFLVTKAAELFIEMLGRETAVCMSQSKRKTLAKQDLEKAVKVSSNLCFLDGILEA